MSEEAKAILEQALKLSVQERAALADDLLDSLDGEDIDFDQEAHTAAWSTEINRRLKAAERDPSLILDGDKVFDEAFALFGGERPR